MYFSGIIIQFIAGISDFLIALVGGGAFFQILRKANKNKQDYYFLFHFLLLSISTIIGGIAGHLLIGHLEPGWKLPGWILSMIAVTCLERAIIEQSSQVLPRKKVKVLLLFNLIEFLFFTYLAINTLLFKYVEYHAAYGLLVVILGIGLLQWKKGLFRIHLFLGLFFSLLAALVFQFHFSISVWWNYLGLSHIMLAFSAYFFFRLSKE